MFVGASCYETVLVKQGLQCGSNNTDTLLCATLPSLLVMRKLRIVYLIVLSIVVVVFQVGVNTAKCGSPPDTRLVVSVHKWRRRAHRHGFLYVKTTPWLESLHYRKGELRTNQNNERPSVRLLFYSRRAVVAIYRVDRGGSFSLWGIGRVLPRKGRETEVMIESCPLPRYSTVDVKRQTLTISPSRLGNAMEIPNSYWQENLGGFGVPIGVKRPIVVALLGQPTWRIWRGKKDEYWIYQSATGRVLRVFFLGDKVSEIDRYCVGEF